jgi:hypothetical protein
MTNAARGGAHRILGTLHDTEAPQLFPLPVGGESPAEGLLGGHGALTAMAVRCCRPSPGHELLAQLQRRHAAAKRIPGTDPLSPAERPLGREREHPRSNVDPPLTSHQLDSWAIVARHVLDAGYMPLVPLDVRRSLWRRGGTDRRLAELLQRGCGGGAA